jgi:hypothetical protein
MVRNPEMEDQVEMLTVVIVVLKLTETVFVVADL